jgi:hypothetical protein
MFKEQVCRPIQDVIEKKMQSIFKEKTNIFDFHLRELTLTDEETASRIDERYLRWDVIRPNEVREKLDLPLVADGDEGVGVLSQASVRADSVSGRGGMNVEQQNANQIRVRDAENSGGPDTPGSDRTRNVQGEGRRVQ